MGSASARSRALGALWGLAVGDALGMPTELMTRAEVARRFGTLDRFEPGPPDAEVSAGLPAGRVTDDTDQALIVARLLVAGGGHVSSPALAAELLAWEARMRASGAAELLGPSTKRALAALAAGVPEADAGRSGETNGAAMRIAGVGVAVPSSPLDLLVDRVEEASRLTHNTGVAIAGAAAVAAAVSAGVEGASAAAALSVAVRAAGLGGERGWRPDAGSLVAQRIRDAVDLVTAADDEAAALDVVHDQVGTSLATHESVPAALALVALCPDDPWRAVRLAAGLGGDSDTIAAMAGAVSGAVNGVEALPAEAIDVVRRVNSLSFESLADELLALRGRA